MPPSTGFLERTAELECDDPLCVVICYQGVDLLHLFADKETRNTTGLQISIEKRP